MPVEERLDHILAEDEVAQEGEGRQEHEGRNADGPGKEADDAAKDTVPAYDEAGREASVETQESISKDRYSASRGHKRGGPDEVASQDGNHQMAEAEAKRSKTIDRGVELIKSLPAAGDSWEVKRGFSLEMAKFLRECDLSPRYLRANVKYVNKRAPQHPDKVKKE